MTRSSWRFLADNPGVTCWTAWTGTHSTLLLIPVEEGRVYGYAASAHGGSVGTEPEWLGRAFTGFPEPATHTIAGVLAGPGELLRAPVEEIHLRRWHRGRVLLIGDAAHATGPVWAQGAAMALEDALVLADLLGRHRDWTGVGAAYEQGRRARVDHVRAATDSMSRLARLPSWLRDFTAPALGPRAYRKAYQPTARQSHVRSDHCHPCAGGDSRRRRIAPTGLRRRAAAGDRMAAAPRRTSHADSREGGDSAVVVELQGDVEVGAAQQLLHRLQVVALLAADPQLVALDLRLHTLGALVADQLGDLLGVVGLDALLDPAEIL